MKILRRFAFVIACIIGVPLMFFGILLSFVLYVISWIFSRHTEFEELLFRFWEFVIAIPDTILGEPDM